MSASSLLLLVCSHVMVGLLGLAIASVGCRAAGVGSLKPWRCSKCGHLAGPDCTTNHQRFSMKYFATEGMVTMCCQCGARLVQQPLDAPHVETPGAVSVVEDKP